MFFKNAFVQSLWELVEAKSKGAPTHASPFALNTLFSFSTPHEKKLSITSSGFSLDSAISQLHVCDCEEIFRFDNPFRFALLQNIIKSHQAIDTTNASNLPPLKVTSLGSGRLLFEALLALELLEYEDELHLDLIDETYAFGSVSSVSLVQEFVNLIESKANVRIIAGTDFISNSYQRHLISILEKNADETVDSDKTNDVSEIKERQSGNEVKKVLKINFFHTMKKYPLALSLGPNISKPRIFIDIDVIKINGNLNEIVDPVYNQSLMKLMPSPSIWISVNPNYEKNNLYLGTMTRFRLKNGCNIDTVEQYVPAENFETILNKKLTI